jgi:hypothetical protein
MEDKTQAEQLVLDPSLEPTTPTDLNDAIHAWFQYIGQRSAQTVRERIAAQVAEAHPDLSPDAQAEIADLLYKRRMRQLSRKGGEATRKRFAEERNNHHPAYTNIRHRPGPSHRGQEE